MIFRRWSPVWWSWNRRSISRHARGWIAESRRHWRGLLIPSERLHFQHYVTSIIATSLQPPRGENERKAGRGAGGWGLKGPVEADGEFPGAQESVDEDAESRRAEGRRYSPRYRTRSLTGTKPNRYIRLKPSCCPPCVAPFPFVALRELDACTYRICNPFYYHIAPQPPFTTMPPFCTSTLLVTLSWCSGCARVRAGIQLSYHRPLIIMRAYV